MQAALMLRSKSRERRKARLKRGIKHELPSNVATRSIAPFPRYPPASWCAAGRAAWQEAAALSVGEGGAAGGAARRCSVLGDHPGARRDQRKWHRNNRVRDASYGSSSESDCSGERIPGEPWGVARLLYAGLGTLALGLVVYFVGTGDKGFKTPALRLVGPSLIVAGLACCLLRIAFCVFAKPCCQRRNNYKESRRLDGYDGEQLPLAGPRAGPAQCSPARRLDTSSCDVSSLSSGEEDERMRRYRTNAPPPPRPHLSPRSAPPLLQQETTYLVTSSCDVSSLSSGEEDERMRRYRTNAPPPPRPHLSPRSAPPLLQQGAVQIAVQQKPEPAAAVAGPAASGLSPVVPPSSNGAGGAVGTSGALGAGSRRPPPRNVSFATPGEGELVLSPAQLRS